MNSAHVRFVTLHWTSRLNEHLKILSCLQSIDDSEEVQRLKAELEESNRALQRAELKVIDQGKNY